MGCWQHVFEGIPIAALELHVKQLALGVVTDAGNGRGHNFDDFNGRSFDFRRSFLQLGLLWHLLNRRRSCAGHGAAAVGMRRWSRVSAREIFIGWNRAGIFVFRALVAALGSSDPLLVLDTHAVEFS